jgi:hypothetical protein
LIAAAGRELKKNEGIYKTPKFQSAELKAKIEDNKNTLADLKKEKDIGLPKKIESNLSAITALDLKLTRLYEQIKSVTPTIDLVGAYAATGANLDDVSDNLLGRPYKVEELEKLATGDESTQKALTKEASARAASMNGDLSPRDKDTLINPIDPDRLRSFLKVTGEVRNRPDHFNQAVLNDLLTEGEQLRLYYREGEQVEVAKKIFERSKVSAVNSLKVLNKQFDNFFAEIVKVDPAAGMNPITSHLQTENLLDALECDMKTGACKKANALVVRVVDVGGNNKVKKNLVTMIATGDSVSHSGGAIIEYKLYDLHGNVLTSSVCSAYAPYRNARNINASSVPAMQAVCSPVPANASGNGNGDAKFGEKAAVTKGRRRMQ